jgi:hypothetical protein
VRLSLNRGTEHGGRLSTDCRPQRASDALLDL